MSSASAEFGGGQEVPTVRGSKFFVQGHHVQELWALPGALQHIRGEALEGAEGIIDFGTASKVFLVFQLSNTSPVRRYSLKIINGMYNSVRKSVHY